VLENLKKLNNPIVIGLMRNYVKDKAQDNQVFKRDSIKKRGLKKKQ